MILKLLNLLWLFPLTINVLYVFTYNIDNSTIDAILSGLLKFDLFNLYSDNALINIIISYVYTLIIYIMVYLFVYLITRLLGVFTRERKF